MGGQLADRGAGGLDETRDSVGVAGAGDVDDVDDVDALGKGVLDYSAVVG